jgi:hypothetical protein
MKKVFEKPECLTTAHCRFPSGCGVMLTPAGLAVADEDDPLAVGLANLTGVLIRYARVSTSGQNLDRQARALTEAGCIRIFAGKQPGKTAGPS